MVFTGTLLLKTTILSFCSPAQGLAVREIGQIQRRSLSAFFWPVMLLRLFVAAEIEKNLLLWLPNAYFIDTPVSPPQHPVAQSFVLFSYSANYVTQTSAAIKPVSGDGKKKKWMNLTVAVYSCHIMRYCWPRAVEIRWLELIDWRSKALFT